MFNKIIKIITIVMILLLTLTMFSGCGEKSLTQEEAYKIYYGTIEKFVPEIMGEPQECDVEITTRDEVTFLTENFVRNTHAKIQSQNVDGKLQYYLLNEFPEAEKMSFYCIDDNKFYVISSAKLNEKGTIVERNIQMMPSYLFAYLNTPFFKEDAIKSFEVEQKDADTVISFIVDGTKMEEGYDTRVMAEISPSIEDELDDVEIILTLDENNTPKTMSTKISMSMFNNSGKLHAQKTLNMNFVFNKLDNVDLNLKEVASKYAENVSIIQQLFDDDKKATENSVAFEFLITN